MEWTDVNLKKKGQVAFCILEGPISNKSSSDGSIYLSIPLYAEEGKCLTNSYLPPKIAIIGQTVYLKHPDTQEDLPWKVTGKGPSRWVNDRGEILWGTK